MEREARRKKIASRGTDRMALITGRIQTIDPNISKSCSFSNPTLDYLPAQHSRSSSEPAGDENRAMFHDYPHGEIDVKGEDDVPDPLISHDKDEDEVSRENASGKRVSDLDEKEVAILSFQSGDFPEKPFEYHLSSITPKEINFSIISSENTRVICSFVIAILVVLSHINLPHNVVKSKSLIAYRPLYAVLVTDMLIVAARLALYSEGKVDDKEVKFEGGGENWDGAVKLLEWGLVLHQTLRAVFIDCSFYLAIVVCGLSLA
ncbi:hypothetical protein DH2020_016392 [Rehmannia glutinosa]|uniref:Uncharacterized protein n=1 Tax=Rehmannia glutinosa TaxID=99300 RepID=A0ABR0WN09_REHGL